MTRAELETLMKGYKKKVNRYPMGYTLVGDIFDNDYQMRALTLSRTRKHDVVTTYDFKTDTWVTRTHEEE